MLFIRYAKIYRSFFVVKGNNKNKQDICTNLTIFNAIEFIHYFQFMRLF